MKNVLDLGQCDYDHPRIVALLEPFGVKVWRAHTFEDARKLMQSQKFDLILVNRITDVDGTSGHKFIAEVKGSDGKSGPNIMLVSNYPEAQEAAIKLGALPGFGKDYLEADTTRERIEAGLK